ncbi:MAG TPA: hypothetical protein VFJ30_05605 [Phycisphaerae bacterium]|nr:hypothetical protein [Phycisphaerae bacterium]
MNAYSVCMIAVELSPTARIYVGILLAGWVAMALHTALAMRRRGRRWWLWLLISVAFSVIPAAIVSYVDYFRQLRRADRTGAAGDRWLQCPHCGAVLRRSDLPGAEAGAGHCPRCNGIIDESRLA